MLCMAGRRANVWLAAAFRLSGNGFLLYWKRPDWVLSPGRQVLPKFTLEGELRVRAVYSGPGCFETGDW